MSLVQITIVDRNDHEEYNLRLNLRDAADPIAHSKNVGTNISKSDKKRVLKIFKF